MTNLEQLRSLQSRIRLSTGPDRELDVDIAKAFYPDQLWCAFHPYAPEDVAAYFTTDPDGLGACKALQEAVLPRWRRGVHQHENGKFNVCMFEGITGNFEGASHALETHAHLLAIIAALVAQMEAKEAVS